MAVHVLLVQDEFSCINSLHRALCDRGYAVMASEDARHALAWARRHQPDLVFLAGHAPPRPTRKDPTTPLPGFLHLHAAEESGDLCFSLKLHRDTNLLPVVRVRNGHSTTGAVLSLRVEPDAELDDPTCPHALSSAIERAVNARREALREGTLAEVRFALPSEPDRLEEMLHLLAPWLGGCGLSSYAVQQMTLAVREVGANAIEWGHRYQRERVVAVHCRLDSDKVSVLVRDTGPGFDRRNLPHAARPGDPLSHLAVRAELRLRDGGFGILMASGLVDHLCYNDAGNEAQLLKFLPARARPAVAAMA